ncbi:lipoyl(octanoyl) transferase LipB [Rickettsiella grylli]|uniref:Octanoyltransferase n=1 Tax=Rickettsiella grylli TaxID=59196 RepID=A8PQ92_9COXI|nr:lipoyl(octanoyl) transferase LipB [Rickettsiella grylli]EDP47018.1 lipoyltransferase [Rickettsiella grylli]
MTHAKLIIKKLQQADYQTIAHAMRTFTDKRTPETPDEVWLIEHNSVYTLGQAGKREHILNPGNIPVERTDRGGQVTYHGPGQLVVYPLLNLRRLHLGVRELVTFLENTLIHLLATYGIKAEAKKEAPGVYVNTAKIASIGLRIRRGCCYHGLAFNVSMDLKPFKGINPCGMRQLEITQLADLGGPHDLNQVAQDFSTQFQHEILNLN